MSKQVPDYVPGHNLLAGKSVLITAAAGGGIGFSAALRALEEGASALVISDIHERRLAEAVDKLQQAAPQAKVSGVLANVTDEADVQRLVDEAGLAR